jgi:hypothetical protein
MVIGAYGSGPRPKLIFKGASGLGIVASNAGSNVALVDLDLDGYQGSAHAGIRTVQSLAKICSLKGFGSRGSKMASRLIISRQMKNRRSLTSWSEDLSVHR